MQHQSPVGENVQKEKRVEKKENGKYLRKRGKKQKRSVIVAVGVLAALAVVVLPKFFGRKQDAAVLDLNDTTVLAVTDLQDSISATGTVESADSTMVYSTAAYTVKAVHVEIGDYVEAGALLAELDDQSVREQIQSQQINLDQSAANGAQQVQTAQNNYDNYKSGLDQGLNTTLNNAENQVQTAYETYVKARNTYERYVDSLDVGENTTLLNAENTRRNAEITLASARDAYVTAQDQCTEARAALDDAQIALSDARQTLQVMYDALGLAEGELAAMEQEKASLEQMTAPSAEELSRLYELQAAIATKEADIAGMQTDIVTQDAAVAEKTAVYTQAHNQYDQIESTLESTKTAMENAQSNYETQSAVYNATVTSVDNNLDDYRDNMESAWNSYQNAQTALAATQKTVQEQLQSYRNSLTSAQIGSSTASVEESLRQLRVDLEGTQITAPCSGTVTAVYAKVGGSGSGLLFVIEDVENLVVDTTVKGYDVGTVQTGMSVMIRSDATGNRKMQGEITRIAPTSQKTSQGTTDTSTEAVFAAEVRVIDKDTGLRIGMEVQLDYIIGEEENVLTVPYDAVYINNAGKTCVIAAQEQENGKFLLKELEVATGIDDDLDIVVSGLELRAGLRIINEPDDYRMLLEQTLSAGAGVKNGAFPMAGGIFGGVS